MLKKIVTDAYTIEINQAPGSPYVSVTADSPESLGLVLDQLELSGTNPYQEFPPEAGETPLTIMLMPEVLCMFLDFEVLNFGV